MHKALSVTSTEREERKNEGRKEGRKEGLLNQW
jgi:hypothetical protein